MSWLDMSVFIAATRFCLRSSDSRKVILTALIGLALLLPTLSYFPETRPIWFNDYLAFLGLAAAVATPVFAASPQSKIPLRYIALGVLIAIPSILVSSNQTAMAIFPAICIPAYLFGAAMLRSPQRLKFVRALYALTLMIVIVAVPATISIFGAEGSVKSLQSRDRIMNVLATPLKESPTIWITGRGWGHTQRDFSTYISHANVKLWDGSWDAPQRDVFHSHNGFFEALLSAGAPAATGIIALLIALICFSPPGTLALAGAFALGYAALSSFWFQLSVTLPITAIAFAACCNAPIRIPTQQWFPALVLCLLAITTSAQLFTSAKLGEFLVRANFVETNIITQKPVKPRFKAGCRDFPDDSWRDNVVISHQVARFARKFRLAPLKKRAESDALKNLIYFYCLSEVRGLTDKSTTLIRTALTSQASFAFQNQFAPFRSQSPFNGEHWANIANEYVELAPTRTDTLLPYMAHLLKKKDFIELDSIVKILLQNNAEDPVGLWFLGISAVIKGDVKNKKRGIAALRRAIKAGIEIWTPIPAPIKGLLNSGN
ncbi:MAG: hypothetical protein JKY20_05420 [Alphaproteobacteria bacterium]|nr:hypothetical protein [Alphaproteobacteria bacterium]